MKVNGDYLNASTKNTEDELASYDPRIEMLLDRILDEYGLVVCGWSAEWDRYIGKHPVCDGCWANRTHRRRVARIVRP